MNTATALLMFLLLAGTVSLLETVAIRFWAPLWLKRGYTQGWMTTKSRTLRLVAAVFTGLAFGAGLASPYATISFGALTWLAALTISTDLSDQKIPSEPVWSVLWISLLSIATELALTGGVEGASGALFNLVAAESIVLFVMLLIVIVTVGGIGSGDVRLVAALTTTAAWTGAGSILPAMAIAAVGYLITRKVLRTPLGPSAGDSPPVPFAPGLIAGFGITAVAYLFTTVTL